MSTATMTISSALESGDTLFLEGSGSLHEIDVIKGPDGCVTSGRIKSNKTAWVKVNPNKYKQIVQDAKPDKRIALLFNTRQGKKEVYDVKCPYVSISARIESSVQQLAQQHDESLRINEARHREMLELLQRHGEMLLQRQTELQRKSEERLIGELRSELTQLIGNLPIPRNTDVRELAGDGQKKLGGA